MTEKQQATMKNGVESPIGLVPYENNSRTHSFEQIDQIKNSILEFGFTNPVLIDEKKTILAGHGRTIAALELNLKQIPVVIVSGLSEDQKRGYVLMDNKIATNAGWDIGKLSLELATLDDNNFNIEVTGFNLDDIIKIDFNPSINPTIDTKDVTDGQVASKQAELNGKFKDDTKNMTVMCPSCFHEFEYGS